jgi:AraC family transcriptional regulator, alkane utilization regulator
MQLAMSQLRSGNRSVGEVAAQVGYASEAAFSRAFKKASGLSPGAPRRHGGLARLTPLDS